jgi:hypothetical protein
MIESTTEEGSAIDENFFLAVGRTEFRGKSHGEACFDY